MNSKEMVAHASLEPFVMRDISFRLSLLFLVDSIFYHESDHSYVYMYSVVIYSILALLVNINSFKVGYPRILYKGKLLPTGYIVSISSTSRICTVRFEESLVS